MKKKIWRLNEPITVEGIQTLIANKIITTEEAKELIFREEEKIPTDQLKEVKDELKLLRELVLARVGDKETRIIEKHYRDGNWTYYPTTLKTNRPANSPWYTTYCSSAGTLDINGSNTIS